MIPRDQPYREILRRRADRIATLCVHAGDDEQSSSLEPPIVLSSAFSFASAEAARKAFQGESDDLIYGRWRNPTVAALETAMCALEGSEAACATASGMAAVSGALLSILKAGDHVIAPRSMYAESARLLRERLPAFGIETTFVERDADSFARALTPRTRVIFAETPSNPTLAITDLAKLSDIAKAHGVALLVDNTFATPFAQNPLALGADLVIHSMTKSLGGHGDAIGGAICGNSSLVESARDLVVKGFGGVLSPFTAFTILRGIRTFALRQERACENAQLLAERLAGHPGVSRVHHPSLVSHPDHEIANLQMFAYGAVLSFEVAGEDALSNGRTVLESARLATHAVSLGDVRTLLVHPASTTHSTMPKATRELAGIGDGLLRLSVGIESFEDLWGDLKRALEGVAGR